MNTINKLNKKYEELKKKSQEEILKHALLKKAQGFIVEEIVEESSKDDNNSLSLVKRKVTTKEIPPDMSAIKYLLELDNLTQNKYSTMTDEELQQEKLNLLKLLKEEENIESN